jgi:hypothetical protein
VTGKIKIWCFSPALAIFPIVFLGLVRYAIASRMIDKGKQMRGIG